MNKQYGYTDPGSDFPQYINYQALDDGKMRFTIRGAKKPDGGCGETVSIDLSRLEASKLREAMLEVGQP